MPKLNHDSCTACGETLGEHMDHWQPDQAAIQLIHDKFFPVYVNLAQTLIDQEASVLDLVGHLDLARQMMEMLRDRMAEIMRDYGQDTIMKEHLHERIPSQSDRDPDHRLDGTSTDQG